MNLQTIPVANTSCLWPYEQTSSRHQTKNTQSSTGTLWWNWFLVYNPSMESCYWSVLEPFISSFCLRLKVSMFCRCLSISGWIAHGEAFRFIMVNYKFTLITPSCFHGDISFITFMSFTFKMKLFYNFDSKNYYISNLGCRRNKESLSTSKGYLFKSTLLLSVCYSLSTDI